MQENTVSDEKQPEKDASEEHMKQIAKLVRGMRTQRGLTRKDLSKMSSISERYLAQVEAGKANISIALLWRMAEAMQVNVSSFLPQVEQTNIQLGPLKQFLEGLSLEQEKKAFEILLKYFSGGKGPTGGIALIGLRGAGKSTLGRILAESANIPFISLTQVIEKLAGLEIPEILSMFGQRAYRRLEHQAIDYVLENNESVILEVGGSLVSESETFNHLLSSFYTVWIRAKLEDHLSRVLAQGETKPLRDHEKAIEDLKHILEEREPFYMAANWVIDTSERSIEECAKELSIKCRCFCCEWSQ